MRPIDEFISSLAPRMFAFIGFKRMQGYDYSFGMGQLRRFDRFLNRIGYEPPSLDLAVFERYRAELTDLGFTARQGALSSLRQFSLYLQAFEPQSEVLPLGLVPRRARPLRFYALSPAQVARLMEACETLAPRQAPRAQALRVLIGLLYSTGLRIAEALGLELRDVDFEQATLRVRRGKFGKDRIVVMSPSTREALQQWMGLRATYAGSEPTAAVFAEAPARRLCVGWARHNFRTLCKQCGLNAQPPPRLHDLRHNYACECLAQWRAAGEDVHALLPVLAHAMGHVGIHSTQLYLHTGPAAFRQAATIFHRFSTSCSEHSQ